jgi:hypothetical protein
VKFGDFTQRVKVFDFHINKNKKIRHKGRL